MSQKSKTRTLSEKLSELDTLVDWFNQDDFALEDAVSQFKKADTLATEIEADLATLKNDITVLGERFDS